MYGKTIILVIFASISVDQSDSASEQLFRCLFAKEFIRDHSFGTKMTYYPPGMVHIIEGVNGRVDLPEIMFRENIVGSIAINCRNCTVFKPNYNEDTIAVDGADRVAILTGPVCRVFASSTITNLTVSGFSGQVQTKAFADGIHFPQVSQSVHIVPVSTREIVLNINDGQIYNDNATQLIIMGQTDKMERKGNGMTLHRVTGYLVFPSRGMAYVVTVAGAKVTVIGDVEASVVTWSAASISVEESAVTSNTESLEMPTGLSLSIAMAIIAATI